MQTTAKLEVHHHGGMGGASSIWAILFFQEPWQATAALAVLGKPWEPGGHITLLRAVVSPQDYCNKVVPKLRPHVADIDLEKFLECPDELSLVVSFSLEHPDQLPLAL